MSSRFGRVTPTASHLWLAMQRLMPQTGRRRIANNVAKHLGTENRICSCRGKPSPMAVVRWDGWMRFDSVNPQKAPWGPQGPTGPLPPTNVFAEIPSDPPRILLTATVAEVQVDVESGIVSVDQVWCAHDLGRVLHPEIAEGQIEGCVYMGVGEALLEEQTYELGQMSAPSILEYKNLTIFDTPDIHALLIESRDPGGPGAKEVGEGPQLAVVPAIGNAIHDAVGIRLTRRHSRQTRSSVHCKAVHPLASNPCQTYWPKGTQLMLNLPLFSWKDPTRCRDLLGLAHAL